jgi:ABC-2 type transport system permease protein
MTSIVIATRTAEIGDQINNGTLSNFLIRPISYMKYWFARDLGDKAMNLVFSVVEITLLIIIFKPNLFIQNQPQYIAIAFVSALISMTMYFYFNYLLGLLGFWSNEIWGPRFIFWILLNFFAGSLFPLDILPNTIFNILKFLPFTYLLYFPLKIYLGQLETYAIIEGLIISILWTFILYFVVKLTWNKGLKVYGAEGK